MKKEKQIKENLSNEINPEVQDPSTEVLPVDIPVTRTTLSG